MLVRHLNIVFRLVGGHQGLKKLRGMSLYPVPDCINSEDPLGLEESWEKEPEDGFIVLEPDQSGQDTNHPITLELRDRKV